MPNEAKEYFTCKGDRKYNKLYHATQTVLLRVSWPIKILNISYHRAEYGELLLINTLGHVN